MSQPLTIVARIEAKPNSVEQVKSELIKLIEPTRKEKGCIQYDLHQDNQQPEIFLFFENWESRELWQDHMKSQHLHAFKQATESIVKSTVINEMTLIV